jgi:sec-independent protein translocase protein TatA
VVGDILQPTHLIFVLVVALLVLGPKRLPEAGRSLGRGLRDFKDALSGDSDDRHVREELAANDTAPAASAQSAPTQSIHDPAPSAPVEAAPSSPVVAPVEAAPSSPVAAPVAEPAPVGADGAEHSDRD